MTKTRFDGVALIVTDIERALNFYRDKLGVETYNMDNYPYYVEFLGFSLWTSSAAQEAVFGELHEGDPVQAWSQMRRFPTVDMAFEVGDVDTLFAKLKEGNNLEVIHEPKTEMWGQRTARFFDPDGHLVEIAHWIVTEGETPPKDFEEGNN
ncbi:MAG: VOC family protein [Chloroflexota bacterium]|nr:VOC family protein [Chloroflexota bacterium]